MVPHVQPVLTDVHRSGEQNVIASGSRPAFDAAVCTELIIHAAISTSASCEM
jgi:hypothetical protein